MPEEAKKVMRNAWWSGISVLFQIFSASVVIFIIAHSPRIEVSEFGQLTYALALSILIKLIPEYGLDTYLKREFAAGRMDMKPNAEAALSLRLVLSCVSIAVLAAYVQSLHISPVGRYLCYIMAASVHFSLFSQTFYAFFESRELFHLETIGRAFDAVVLLVMVSTSLALFDSLIVVVLCFPITRFSGLIFNYILCGRKLSWIWPKPDFLRWKTLLVGAMPFALLVFLATSLTTLGTVILRELVSSDAKHQLGLYQSVMHLVILFGLIPNILFKALLPQLARIGGNGHPTTAILCIVNNTLMTIGVLVGVFVVCFSEQLLTAACGSKYAVVSPVLQVYGLVLMLRFGAAYNLYFTLEKRMWFRAISCGVSVAGYVILNLLLIPKYGLLGAGYAALASHMLYWLICLGALYRHEGQILLGWDLKNMAVILICWLGLIYLTKFLNFYMMLPVYVIYVAAAAYLSIPRRYRHVFHIFQPANGNAIS